MVLVVASVQVDVTRVDEQEREQDEEDLNGVFASVHKISVEHVRPLQRWHAILSEEPGQMKTNNQDLRAGQKWVKNTDS